MKKEELLKELERDFEKMKKESGLKSNLEELDRNFGIKNQILRDGFVSENLSSQICSRVVDLFTGWGNYVHSLIMPNPQNMMNMSEAKLFDSEERKKLTELMSIAMERSSKNGLLNLKEDDEEKIKFIDESMDMWKNSFENEIIKILEKVNIAWGTKK